MGPPIRIHWAKIRHFAQPRTHLSPWAKPLYH